MGSSKKHKKHKSERREYEEYDPQQHRLKLILKVGSNSGPEHSGVRSPHNNSASSGPPTAAEAMMSAAPSSPVLPSEDQHREWHKKSKKKKKKKDREKKHKHHKEKKHRSERHRHSDPERHLDASSGEHDEKPFLVEAIQTPAAFSHHRSPKSLLPENDSSQDDFSFMEDDNSQPLPENILFYAGITTDNSPSCRPVSKPIVPHKVAELLIDSPASSSLQSSSFGIGGGSPNKLLPDLLIPSPSHSMAASTPGGASSLAGLTPKALEAPKTPSSSSESGREPRTCVLKLKQQKSSLNKLLDHLLRFLEKRDPHQFFAWPVTDDIAPGYSSIISKPMDFSTIRQNIEENAYSTLTDFKDDFKRMCDNAIRYNHVDTVYHKAAKRLLQIGVKQLTPECLLRSLKPPLSGYLRDLTAKDLGFDLNDYGSYYDQNSMADSADEGASTSADEPTPAQLEEEEKRRALRLANDPKTRFEAYVDDLMPEEILAQVQLAARAVKKRLSAKDKAHQMGFLRQNKDGTTSLKVLLKDENEGPEKVVSIGELVGKLKSGSGQLHVPRDDKRNEAKIVKSLNYGAFASFAPLFDSRFSNLGKEETQLVLQTYGDATSIEYAESILQFTKNSNYASMLANGLLDVLTSGEHGKTCSNLFDLQMQNYEQQEIQKCFAQTVGSLVVREGESREQIEADYDRYKNTRIDFNRLRTLSEFGIDVGFLDAMEVEMRNAELTRRLQEHLSNNLNLIEKLRASQHDRLSQPLPHHLAHVPPPGQEETHLAQQITQQLSDVAKKLPPSAIADAYGLRKAMGLSYVGLPTSSTHVQRVPVPELLQEPVCVPQIPLSQPCAVINTVLLNNSVPTLHDGANVAATVAGTTTTMDIDDDIVAASSGGDLENELREFLESGTGLHATNADDNNIVAQLLMN